MASNSATKDRKIHLICTFLFISISIIHVSCFEYVVGGDRGKGWLKPDGSETETYNEWAEQHRFHIGDTIRFKYSKDSVLVVDSEDYGNCNGTRPVAKFEDGNTVFEFDRSGFFFFISGKPGHCEAGQKMIIRVMVQSGVQHPPARSPSPSPSPLAHGPDTARDGGDGSVIDSWGPGPGPAVNSTVMLSVTSYLMTLFLGVVIVLYLF
ncbi:early nodulin-like protein 6 [Silene latifolia]|uniref:early nodulin-like protein 6 n=1 Tax=Silene latifolia TaxID=37657 RepID=UPI003D77B2E7